MKLLSVLALALCVMGVLELPRAGESHAAPANLDVGDIATSNSCGTPRCHRCESDVTCSADGVEFGSDCPSTCTGAEGCSFTRSDRGSKLPCYECRTTTEGCTSTRALAVWDRRTIH